MKSIDASVIVPTCDRPAELLEALSSLAGQTHANFEIVIVNDGEIDVSDLVAKAAASLRGRPVLMAPRGRRTGPSAARNRGLAMARGDVIFYLDDDIFYTNHIAVHLAAHTTAPTVGAIYSDACHGTITNGPDGATTIAWSLPYSRDFDADELLVANYIPVLCLSHRRELLARAGGFEETLASLEDWDFFIRLSLLGDFIHLPEVTAAYFERERGASVQVRQAQNFVTTILSVYARGDALIAADPSRINRVWRHRLRYIGDLAEATARHCEAAGDFPGAATAWDNAVRHAPTPERYLALARIQKRLGQGPKALISMHLAATCRDMTKGT